MFVSMWMTRQLVTAHPDDSIVSIAALMTRQRIRRVLIVTPDAEGSQLRGIVSFSDVMHAFPANVNPKSVSADEAYGEAATSHSPIRAADIMTAHPRTIAPDTPIEAAARLMLEHKVGALPVVSERGLVGLITESDIFRAFVALFHPDERSVRISFEIGPGEDVFMLVASIAQRRGLRIATFVTLAGPKPLGVMQLVGPRAEDAIDELWKSHHRVLSVQHT